MRKHKIGRILYAAFLSLALSSLSSHAHAEDADKARHKHQTLQEWLSLLSGEDRARLRNAKKEALKNSTVQAARRRRHVEVQREYRALLCKEMLATCSVCSGNLCDVGSRIGSKPWLTLFDCQRQFL